MKKISGNTIIITIITVFGLVVVLIVYNMIDKGCHPDARQDCCNDGSYYAWNQSDYFHGHGKLWQRCAQNVGMDISKFVIYNGDNIADANLFQWDTDVGGFPNLTGSCPEKLWLEDNQDNIIMEMGHESFDGLGTHVNTHGPAGTELIIPADVDWETFNPNDINTWEIKKVRAWSDDGKRS